MNLQPSSPDDMPDITDTGIVIGTIKPQTSTMQMTPPSLVPPEGAASREEDQSVNIRSVHDRHSKKPKRTPKESKLERLDNQPDQMNASIIDLSKGGDDRTDPEGVRSTVAMAAATVKGSGSVLRRRV